MSQIDATRLQKVEVDISFPAVDQAKVQHFTLRESDARGLMHALASALGYTSLPNDR